MTRLRMLLGQNGVSLLAALLLLFAVAAWPCPPACYRCSVYVAQCEHFSSLRKVLAGLSNHTQKIVLQHGNLSKMPPFCFTKFPHLHFLSITGCPISSLNDFTFSSVHVNSLRVLNLSNNHLHSCMIEPMAFSGLLFLHELILTNNSLDILRRSWFLEMPVLLRLHLGGNRITYLPPRMFESLTRLGELVVSSNLIQYLPMDTFYGMPLLTKLDLSNNRILFINHEVFQPLQALKHLLLFQNRLTVLPTLPSSISLLFLHENPWECTCQLVVSLVPLLAKIQSPNGVTCDGPPSLAGQLVASTRPEGCSLRSEPQAPSSSLSSSSSSFPSSSSSSSVAATHVATSGFWNLSLLYGFLGGVLICLVICLILCCFCHFRRYCNCVHFEHRTKSRQTYQNQMSRSFLNEERPSNTEPHILCSFPVVENTAAGFETGHMVRRMSYGCSSENCRTSHVEQKESSSQKPLVAVLSMDAAGKTVVTLHEAGTEVGGPAMHQSHCHMHEENTDGMHKACEERADKVTACAKGCGSEQQCSAERQRGSCDSCHAASSQVERKNCALEKSVERPVSHPEIQLGGLQCPQTLVHIDFHDGSALKMEKDHKWVCEISSKRKESQPSGFHSHTSHHGSAIRRKASSLWRPSHHHQACLVSPQTDKASRVKLWQESLVRSRHPKHRIRSGESTWKTGLYSDFSLLASKVNTRQEWKPLHDRCPHPTSSTTSTSSIPSTSSQSEENGLTYPKETSIEMRCDADHPRIRARSSQQLGNVSQVRRRHPEYRKARGSQDPVIGLKKESSIMEKEWKCSRCGFKNSSAHSIAQRTHTQWNSSPRTSRRMRDVVTRQSSTSTIHLKERERAFACFSQDENSEKSLPEESRHSRDLPALPPPTGVSQTAQCENDAESTYEELCPPVASAMPLTEETSTQLILKNEVGRVGILKAVETGRVVDHSMDTYSPRNTDSGEEIVDGEGSLEAVPLGVLGQDLMEGGQDTPCAYSNVMLSESCYDASRCFLYRIEANLSLMETSISSRSCSERPYSDAQGDGYEELTTAITSCCPVVQKMCQINFPLLSEEDEPQGEYEDQTGELG
ncbi:uncharacterized protein LOC121936956 [Sceloporus undulatus]|uniref:uncharacterized protein LOC121936956 n=1 Tax=Sceloporus undulatus TaxID=8520 RepID=UPI001C4D62D6|nr:uncharacterized protein LOC121936956 [Sceloporus undulatus]